MRRGHSIGMGLGISLNSIAQLIKKVFQSSLSASIVPETGALSSFTHVTSHVIKDHEGLWRETAPGSASFLGGRVVRNLFSTADLTDPEWVKLDSATAALSSEMTPDGNAAYDVTLSSSSTSEITQSSVSTGLITTGRTYVVSFWIKSNTGSNQALRLKLSTKRQTITATPSWQRFSYLADNIGGSGNAGFISNSVAADIIVGEAQLEDVTGQLNQNPSEHVSTGVGYGEELWEISSIDPAWTDNGDGSYTLVGNGTNQPITSTNGFEVGREYVATFNIDTISGGSLKVASGSPSFTLYSTFNTTGTKSVSFTATQTDIIFTRDFPDTINATISNISVKRASHGAGVDGVKWFNTTNGNTVTSNVVTEAVGTALTADKGFVSDPGSTNKCTNHNYTPTSLAGVSIDTPANVAGSVITPSLYPSSLKFIGNGDVYQFVSASLASEVSFSGATGNTNPHSIMIWARKTAGTGNSTVGLASAQIGGQAITSEWTLHKLENLTPSSAANIIKLFVEGGDTVEVIGNKLEESEFCGLPIITEGSATSTTPTTLKNAWPTGLVNDMVFELNVTPLASGQGQVTIASGYTDANNWFEIGHDGTNIYARKRIAGVNYDAVKPLTYVEDTTYNVKARISTTQGIDIWVDNVIGTNHANTTSIAEPASFAIGSMDGAVNMLAAIELVDVHSGSMTGAEVVAL